jgi:hypothetical protein
VRISVEGMIRELVKLTDGLSALKGSPISEKFTYNPLKHIRDRFEDSLNHTAPK